MREHPAVLPTAAALAGFVTFPAVTFTDQTATLLPARQLLLTGSPRVTTVTGPAAAEFVGSMTDRLPGLVALVTPLAWLPYTLALGLAAALWTAWGVRLIQQLYGHRAALLAVCCTPLVFVGREWWPQTVCVPLLLAGVLAVRRGQLVPLVPLLALIGVCRPPMLAFAVGLWLLEQPTAWRGLVAPLVAGTAVALLLLLTWTRVYFHTWGLTGGFGLEPRGQVDLAHMLYIGLLSPQRGLLFYCPWLLLVRPNRQLVLTFAYVLAEWSQYDAWGGNGFLGFRYALPLVVLAAARLRPGGRLLLGWSAGLALGCLLLDDYSLVNDIRDPNLMPPWLLPAACLGVLSAWLSGTARRAQRSAAPPESAQREAVMV